MLSRLDSLLEDVLRLVLAFSTPSCIRSCQQVCCLLRDLVKSDVYLQYLLELDACGYIEPANPWLDLTYTQKLETVRNHRSRWEHPENVAPTVFEIHLNEIAIAFEFVGGVYVRGAQELDSLVGLTRKLYFYQLPVPNRGVEFKQWVISDLGFDARDFRIDLEQDLLVPLESGEGVYKIHLRTMSTNEEHPNASTGYPIIIHQSLPVAAISFYFELSGRLLAILSRSRSRHIHSYVVIWDWTTGQELSRAYTVGGYDTSFTLLSEDLLIVPRFSNSYEVEKDVPGDTYGSMDIYQFDPHAAASTEATRIASFVLPPLEDLGAETSVRIRCTPTNVMPTSQSHSTSVPKVFDLSPNNWLLCIKIDSDSVPGMGLDKPARTLYVPCSLLLDSISKHQQLKSLQPDATIVPWADWAEKTSWVDTCHLSSNNNYFVFRQRMVSFLNNPIDFRRRDVPILDFDQRCVKPPTRLMCQLGEKFTVLATGLQRMNLVNSLGRWCFVGELLELAGNM